MKKLDWYILRQFLGTFVFSITVLLVIVIVFDVSEKIEDFLKTKPSLHDIIVDYYLNFIPYFANLFSHLFTFIAVIFFTSRLAARTEIVAILSSGVSFNRLLRPYIIGASIIAIGSLFLNNFMIPRANQGRLDFENKYIHNAYNFLERNVHRQIAPGTFICMETFDAKTRTGFKFTMEKFKNNQMYYQLKAEHNVWDTIHHFWKLQNYHVRKFKDLNESLSSGAELDTVIPLNIKDFTQRPDNIETMNFTELNAYLKEQKLKGADHVEDIEVEKHSRIAFPFATFILTLIGVSLASRKVRGGIGMHIGLGLLISFSYILFMHVSSVFAQNGVAPAFIAVWIPNVLYTILAIYLLQKAPK